MQHVCFPFFLHLWSLDWMLADRFFSFFHFFIRLAMWNMWKVRKWRFFSGIDTMRLKQNGYIKQQTALAKHFQLCFNCWNWNGGLVMDSYEGLISEDIWQRILTFPHPPAFLRSMHVWPLCWLQSLPFQISWLNTPLCMWAPNKLVESLHFSASCNSLLCNLRCFVSA